MDLGMLETKAAHSFEEYEEEDDDVFYDELRRQVLQLTAEDDDDDVVEDVYDTKIMIGPEARKQGPYSVRQQPVCYEGWPGNKAAATTPAWIANLWRSGNGTGVFIPQGVQSRRKNRSRRKNDRGRTYRRVERSRTDLK